MAARVAGSCGALLSASRSHAARLTAAAGCRQLPVEQACQDGQEACCVSHGAWAERGGGGEVARSHGGGHRGRDCSKEGRWAEGSRRGYARRQRPRSGRSSGPPPGSRTALPGRSRRQVTPRGVKISGASTCRRQQRASRRGSRSRAALLAALAGCRQPPVDQACQGYQQASCISWHAWGRGSSAGEGARWRAERPSEQTLATGSRGRGLRRGGRGAHPQEKSPNSSRLTGDAKNPEAGAEKVVDLAHPRAVMKVEVGGLCTGVSQSEG